MKSYEKTGKAYIAVKFFGKGDYWILGLRTIDFWEGKDKYVRVTGVVGSLGSQGLWGHRVTGVARSLGLWGHWGCGVTGVAGFRGSLGFSGNLGFEVTGVTGSLGSQCHLMGSWGHLVCKVTGVVGSLGYGVLEV